MKLINLKVNYFGPFESEEINFQSLNNKLFLISGRTGSGKTMIFDAIVYALYGSASTTGRDEESLRSQFAPDNQQAEVKLVFEVRGQQYTVERTLKYHKPGNKSATPPKAVLYSGDGDIIASKLNEVRDAVVDIVKLNRDQFRKILILPQGEFKELLVSSSTDKQDILRTLFQTGRFLNFELNLKEKLKEQSKEAEKLDLRINEQIKHIHTEDIDITEQHDFPNYKMILEYNDGINFSYQKKLEELAEEGKRLKTELDEKQKILVEKTQHNEKIDKINALTDEHTQLNQQAASIDSWRDEISQFDKVSAIKYELLRHKELDESIMELTDSLGKEKTRQEELNDNLKIKTDELSELEKKLPDINQRHKKYFKMEGFLSSNYETLNQDITDSKQKLKEKEDEISLLEINIKNMRAEFESLTATHAVALALQQEVGDINGKYNRLTEDIKSAKQYQQLINERLEINHSIDKNNDAVNAQKDKLSLFNSNLAGYDEDTIQTINHLINHLEPGTACPVCEQTVLTLPESAGLSDEDRMELTAINDEISRLETANQKHVMRIDVIDEVLKDKEYQDQDMLNIDLKSVEEEKNEIEAALKETNEDIQKKDQLNKDISSKNEAMHSLTLNLQELKNNDAQLSDKRVEFNEATGFENFPDFKQFMVQEKESIDEFQSNLNQLKETVNELTKQKEVTDAAVKSLTAEFDKTDAGMKKFKKSIDAFMSEHQFTDLSVLHSIINDETITDKKDKVKTFDESNRTLKNQLDELSKNLETKEKVNTEKDDKNVKKAEETLDKAREYYAAVNERKNRNLQSRDYLSGLIDTFNASYDEFSQLNELVDAVQGKKGQKVSLERYVLTYYLERILELANVRLTAMTNHRYKLQRSQKKVNRYSGLDIEVFDYYNNQARNINSLSGGETFQASLVLALALNETLQQESGGITLDTMLIDEGFGTLDHETLEVAISTLIDLQTTGKTIGIISHVEELKERMEHILYVNPDNERSTTKIVTL